MSITASVLQKSIGHTVTTKAHVFMDSETMLPGACGCSWYCENQFSFPATNRG